MDVYGVGILLIGPSGVGKSEVALDLIVRGHRLVADDLVVIRKDAAQELIGSAPEISQHYIEVRGLGLLNVQDLYGAAAVRENKKVDMVLELVPLDAKENIDRLGIVVVEKEILKKAIPHVRVPCWKGRNLTTIIEVAARNQILRWAGKDSAVEFERKHREKMCEPS
jgi:HPr kinase/phosphorylase